MLVDIHVHLNKKESVEATLKEARESGVGKIILAGTNLKDSLENIEIANKYKNTHTAVGIYPQEEIGKPLEETLKALEKLSKHQKIKAIGECGLDYKETKRSKEEQKTLFRMQIKLSLERNLPLIIHSRNSYEDALEELSKFSGTRGVFHCFVGDVKTASKILELGFYLSFNGIITYPSAQHLIKVVEKIPLERIVLETDSPFLVPEPLKSGGEKKNSPKNVRIVAVALAKIKKISLEEVARTTTKNAEKLFLI